MLLKVWNPSAVAGENSVLVAAYDGEYGPDYKRVGITSCAVSMPEGKPFAQTATMAAFGASHGRLCLDNRKVHNPPAAAWIGGRFLVAAPSEGSGQGEGKAYLRKDCVAVCAADGEGKGIGGPSFAVFGPERLNGEPCVSMASAGGRCLLVEDAILSAGKDKGGEKLARRILGVFLTPEGKPSDGGAPFAIFDGTVGKTVPLRASVCAGSEGKFLVVCSEARGVDDVKIVSRIVK